MSRTRSAVHGALAAAIFAALGLVPATATAAAKPAAAPPGNSAVNQYTESFPTAGGPRQSSSVKEGDALPTPHQVLGARAARRLQERGAAGRALADLVAATAPHGYEGGEPHTAATARDSQGSSGMGAVVGQALGTSASGKLGLWLPLILLGTLVWAALYAWRRRPRSA